MTTTFTVDWKEKDLLIQMAKNYARKLEDDIELNKELGLETQYREQELKQTYKLWEKIEKGEQTK